jgi:ADP-dependent phosphofructokinase/glucokinase
VTTARLTIPVANVMRSDKRLVRDLMVAMAECAWSIAPVPTEYAYVVSVNGERNLVQRVLAAADALGVKVG